MSNSQKTKQQTNYSAGLVSQSFWFVEFKKYLKLYSDGCTPDEIKEMVIHENLFGVSNEYRAKRIFGYISNRAAGLDEKGIELFLSSDVATQKLINLICILYQDRLFFEFINEIYRDKAIMGFETIDGSDAGVFFSNKEIQSEAIATWTDATKKKLRTCYFNFLIDSNLITVIDKTKKITQPLLDKNLERYLEARGETFIIKAITGVC